MEYVFTEGTASPYDVMYDTVHAVPATPVSVAQSTLSSVTRFGYQRKLVRTSDGTLYAVYTKLLAAQYQVYVIRSVDEGATWTDDTRISTAANMATNLQQSSSMAVDSSDRLHIVWRGYGMGHAQPQIWYALYDGSWHTPIRISTQALGTEVQNYPSIAVDSSDNLHVAWEGQPGTPNVLIWYTTAVPPYGATEWVAPVVISTAGGMGTYAQYNAAITVDSNDYIHVVWRGKATGFTTHDQIWYNKYTTSWAGPIRISTAANMATNNQALPSIAVDSNDNLHVVWYGPATDFATNQIRYAKGVPPHAAANWVTPIRISDALNMATNAQQFPSIAVDSSDSLYVVWHGKATGYVAQNVVWLAVYVISWATPEVLQPTGRNQYPNLRWSRWPR